MPNVTMFDTQARYVLFSIFIITKDGERHEFDALLDTGAPATEFSGQALQYAGLLKSPREDVRLKPGLQTQRYGKMILPEVEICSHVIGNMQVYVSHFEKSWGIDALIGLDFFRRFRTTIDYKAGHLVTEALLRG